MKHMLQYTTHTHTHTLRSTPAKVLLISWSTYRVSALSWGGFHCFYTNSFNNVKLDQG